MAPGAKEIFVSTVQHDVRVAIDEEGVTAAAYTVMAMSGAGAPPDDEIDFVLDRPFLFALTSPDGRLVCRNCPSAGSLRNVHLRCHKMNSL